jgi:hypothetical protein
VLVVACMLAACDGFPSEEIVGEGSIAALSEDQLLIQEKTSVVTLDMKGATGRSLAARYKAGQGVKLVGTKSIDEFGEMQETIKAIEFEDGKRLRISSY